MYPWIPSPLTPEMALRPSKRHGTRSRYADGCRCDVCRTMHAIIHNRGGYRAASAPTHQSRAHSAVERAVRNGRLVVPESCDECGKKPRRRTNGRRGLEAHHDDYTRPLEVRWLCGVCHREGHVKQRRPLPTGVGADVSDRRRVHA